MSNYPLRLPETVMEDARALAEQHGVSINQFLAAVIAERIGELKAARSFQMRVARAKSAKALSVLAKVPDRKPMPGDEMPS